MNTYFFIALAITIIGIIGAVINMFSAATNIHGIQLKSVAARHVVFGLMYVLGGIATVVTGIIWAVQYLKH